MTVKEQRRPRRGVAFRITAGAYTEKVVADGFLAKKVKRTE